MTTSDAHRNWSKRVRSLQDRRIREQEGVVFVEGIRQVIAAFEGGHHFEAVLVDQSRLRSDVAWKFISEFQASGEPVFHLAPHEFQRLSSRDNPIGLAATVRWTIEDLRFVEPVTDGLYLATDNIRDPGNLGTLMRSADAFGAAGLIIHSGTDASHPTALRASLGTAFRLAVHTVPTLKELLYWASRNGITTIATTAHDSEIIWDAPLGLPAIVLLGNEAQGLDAETLELCDHRIRVPMAGSATSLNVSVAAGIVLYEIRRRLAM